MGLTCLSYSELKKMNWHEQPNVLLLPVVALIAYERATVRALRKILFSVRETDPMISIIYREAFFYFVLAQQSFTLCLPQPFT